MNIFDNFFSGSFYDILPLIFNERRIRDLEVYNRKNSKLHHFTIDLKFERENGEMISFQFKIN